MRDIVLVGDIIYSWIYINILLYKLQSN